MTDALTVSVVVVSRERPDALKRCLLGVAQLRYPMFEVVVVADKAGVTAASTLPFSATLKIVSFDQANISQARNLGLSHAAGEIIAFIDDDAVPEPSWLTHLIAPFSRDTVAAAGGFVRARNGISFQYKARSVDRFGATEEIEVNEDRATVFTPKSGRAIKTEGTNMAVRRDVLVALEGFDPAFAFFLDETDLNLRLARNGYATAIVPLAQVHHGFAQSARRRTDRVPRDLFDIGASWAVFQRKYLPQEERTRHWRAIRLSERQRLLNHMIAGLLEPRDVRVLMHRLDMGYGQGLERARGGAEVSQSAAQAFRLMPIGTGRSRLFAGRAWQRRQLHKKAADAVGRGEIATVLRLSPTALFHRHVFTENSYWEQVGGLFGKSDRAQTVFQIKSFAKRVTHEQQRISKYRLLD